MLPNNSADVPRDTIDSCLFSMDNKMTVDTWTLIMMILDYAFKTFLFLILALGAYKIIRDGA